MSSTKSSATENEVLDVMMVIKPALERYYANSHIGIALFDRDESSTSSDWCKKFNLNSNEWSTVQNSLNADSKFAALSKMVPERHLMLISSNNMMLECDFCAMVYATATTLTLKTNKKDSPPILFPEAESSSQEAESRGTASVPKERTTPKSGSSAEARSSASAGQEAGEHQRPREEGWNACRIGEATELRLRFSLPMPIANEMVVLFELGVGLSCNPYYKLIQLEVRLQAYQTRRWFARRSVHSVDVCGLVLNTGAVKKIAKLFVAGSAPALSQTMYNEGRLLLLCADTVGQLAYKSNADVALLEKRMTAVENSVTDLRDSMNSQFAAMNSQFAAMNSEFQRSQSELRDLILASRPSTAAQANRPPPPPSPDAASPAASSAQPPPKPAPAANAKAPSTARPKAVSKRHRGNAAHPRDPSPQSS